MFTDNEIKNIDFLKNNDYILGLKNLNIIHFND